MGLGLEKLMPVYSVVSPLSWPSKVPAERSFMYAGLGDRMSTPGQAQRLWHHWSEPRVLWYEGSHLTSLWSGKVSRFLDDCLAEAGWIDPRPPSIPTLPTGADETPVRRDQPVA